VTTLGWAGVALLVAAGLGIVVEGILAAVWGLAVARRAAALAERLKTEQAMLESDLEKLRLALEETRRLWRPYRTALRWLGHPLTIALWQSYLRRGLVR
jgi:uncharacterized membrane protein YhiD involved in acid resistance